MHFGKQSEDGRRRFEETRTSEVPNNKLPLVFFGLNFSRPPGILLDQPPLRTDSYPLWTKYNHAEILKFLKDGEGYRIGSVEPLLFCRMLAKIAHGFAAAEIGLCNFMPLLPDLILGRSYAPTHWIGGPGRINEADAKGGHKLQLEMMRSVSGRVYHSVNVRLFCPFATPDYHIVVGERR